MKVLVNSNLTGTQINDLMNNSMNGLNGNGEAFLFQNFLMILLSYLNQDPAEGKTFGELKNNPNFFKVDLGLSNLREVYSLKKEPVENEGENSFSLFALALLYLENLLSSEKEPVLTDSKIDTQTLSLNDLKGNFFYSKDRTLELVNRFMNLFEKSTYENKNFFVESIISFKTESPDITEKSNLKDFTPFKVSLESQNLIQDDLLRQEDGLNENLKQVSEPLVILTTDFVSLKKFPEARISEPLKSLTTFEGFYESKPFESNQIINNLSQEAREFLKTYEEVFKALLKGENPEAKLNNLKVQFEALSASAKEELKKLIQEIKKELRITLPQREVTQTLDEGLSRQERITTFFFFSKGKRLEIKEVGLDTHPKTNLFTPLQTYLKLEELKPAPRLLQEPRSLPRVSLENINYFIRDFTVELLPTGEKKAFVQLEPPEFGRMELEVKVYERKVEILIRVEKEEALSHLQSELPQIKAQLESFGLEVKNFELSFGLTPQHREFGKEERGKGGGFGDRREIKKSEEVSSGEERVLLHGPNERRILYKIV